MVIMMLCATIKRNIFCGTPGKVIPDKKVSNDKRWSSAKIATQKLETNNEFSAPNGGYASVLFVTGKEKSIPCVSLSSMCGTMGITCMTTPISA